MDRQLKCHGRQRRGEKNENLFTASAGYEKKRIARWDGIQTQRLVLLYARCIHTYKVKDRRQLFTAPPVGAVLHSAALCFRIDQQRRINAAFGQMNADRTNAS